MSLLNNISHLKLRNKSLIPREDYDILLSTAQGNAEKKILKHTLCSSQNLSRRQASQIYGISKLGKRADEINKTANAIKEIKSRYSAVAKAEKKTFLFSCGENINDYVTSSSDSMPETDDVSSSDDSDSGAVESSLDDMERNNDVPDLDSSHATNKVKIESNIEATAQLLREVSFNWFAFVTLLQSKFVSEDDSMLNSLMTEVASRLSELGFRDDEIVLIEQSRAAYLATIQQKEINSTISFSTTDQSSGESETENLERVEHKERIRTKNCGK